MPTLSANVICVYIYDISLRIKRFCRVNRTFEAFFSHFSREKIGTRAKKVGGRGRGGGKGMNDRKRCCCRCCFLLLLLLLLLLLFLLLLLLLPSHSPPRTPSCYSFFPCPIFTRPCMQKTKTASNVQKSIRKRLLRRLLLY